ncbi:TetR/AcrR family transcriptional regulator [Kroppenstedtia eburnea]|uniref:TetR/AcrR family transcriptional regulator n=1 Tax=Kroppenstedtia eburnea TaxID=714067 RepID=UPI00020DC446|nr:TetR family transcriptional regulator [Desmospora sp. 8437]
MEGKTRTRILQFATEQFFSVGYTQVSVDDFTTELRMSKSTFYKYFSGKEKLLFEVIDHFFKEVETDILDILENDALDLIRKIKKFLLLMGQRISKIRIAAFQDLKRSVPEAYSRLEERRREVILNKLVLLFKEGVITGIFREDLDQQLVVTIIMNAIQNLTLPEFLAQTPYTMEDVFKQVFTLVIEGNLTDSGREGFYRA